MTRSAPSSSSSSGRPSVSEYRFAQSLLVRSMGALLVGVGVLIFVAALLVGFLALPVAVLAVVVVLGLLVIAGAAVWLGRFGTIVRFDADGYQVRVLRGAGVRAARWSDVEDSVTSSSAGQQCIVLRLRDGRTTTVPVGVLQTTPQEFVDDLRRRLDGGRGYRRVR